MKAFLILPLVSMALAACTDSRHITDTLIDYEAAGHSRETLRNAYTMEDLVCALDNSFWEISPGGRHAFVRQAYPDGVPETVISLPESGAQVAIAALRLDKDLLAVITSSDLMGPHSAVRVLQRVPGGWDESTATVFAYRMPKESAARILGERMIEVKDARTGMTQRYFWKGRRFEPT